MVLENFFIFLVIFGIIGYFVEKLWDVNPYKIYSHFGSVILIGVILFLFFPILSNPENINSNVERITDFFVNFFPGAVVGEAAGAIVSEVTGGSQ